MSKCFCHLTDRNGNSYEVKDAAARQAITKLEESVESLSQGPTRQWSSTYDKSKPLYAIKLVDDPNNYGLVVYNENSSSIEKTIRPYCYEVPYTFNDESINIINFNVESKSAFLLVGDRNEYDVKPAMLKIIDDKIYVWIQDWCNASIDTYVLKPNYRDDYGSQYASLLYLQ